MIPAVHASALRSPTCSGAGPITSGACTTSGWTVRSCAARRRGTLAAGSSSSVTRIRRGAWGGPSPHRTRRQAGVGRRFDSRKDHCGASRVRCQRVQAVAKDREAQLLDQVPTVNDGESIIMQPYQQPERLAKVQLGEPSCWDCGGPLIDPRDLVWRGPDGTQALDIVTVCGLCWWASEKEAEP